MPRDERALMDALESIADGRSPDWAALTEGAAVPKEALADLQLIARIAELHRTPPWEPAQDAGKEAANGQARLIGRIGAPDPGRWARLELLEPLGEGTFGRVYRARHLDLGHEVALKILKPQAAGDEQLVERLLEEGRALARVAHENVVRVHGVDVQDGRLGLWMELVRGQTLAQVLAERGPLGAREATLIGQDLCRALAAIHRVGLVHGDVKAQNVMREDGGRTVLMDFGSGRLQGSTAGRTPPPTGTPLYLAPERLAGEGPTVRSDLYSLGVLLFHLTTGRYPVEASSVEGLIEAHRAGHVNRLTDLRPDLPERFVRAVERALDPHPARRYATAGEMEGALARVLSTAAVDDDEPEVRPAGVDWRSTKWLTAILALIALMAVAADLWTRQRRAVPSSTEIDTLAVIPFDWVGEPEGKWRSEGLSDEIAVHLSRLRRLRVVGGTSARRFAGWNGTPDQIGRALGVRTVLLGSVRGSGNRLRVVAQLLDCPSSTQLWAGSFELTSDDLLDVQARIARAIGTALLGELDPASRAVLQPGPMRPEAYSLYLRGRHEWRKRTPEGLRASIDLFNQAIALDERAALPRAGLSDAWILSAIYDVTPADEALRLAERAARAALEIDPQLAEAHAALGAVHHHRFEWAEAEAAFERAITANEDLASAHHWQALLFAQQGRMKEAREAIARAYTLEPFSLGIASAVAYIAYVDRDFDAAIAQYRHVLGLDPSYGWAQAGLAEALAAQGEYDQALAALTAATSRTGRETDLLALRAYVHARAGQTAEATRILGDLLSGARPRRPSFTEQAIVYGALGRMDDAFDALAQARRAGESLIAYAAVEPRLDPLRRDRRFTEFLEELGLPIKESANR